MTYCARKLAWKKRPRLHNEDGELLLRAAHWTEEEGIRALERIRREARRVFESAVYGRAGRTGRPLVRANQYYYVCALIYTRMA